jgi:hypothetical protein
MTREQHEALKGYAVALRSARQAQVDAPAKAATAAAKILEAAKARAVEAQRSFRAKADELGLAGQAFDMQVGRHDWVTVTADGTALVSGTDTPLPLGDDAPDFPITLGPGEVCEVAGKYVAGTDAGAYINEAEKIALRVGEIAPDGAIWHLADGPAGGRRCALDSEAETE